jgi:cation diffusion facilitator CzcD-associated flavoprotein CzcO
MNERASHALSIAIVGSGVGGIAAAIQLRKAGIDSFTIFEKSDGPGGTWRDNRYPGAACDVPSVLYSFSYRQKLDWARAHATQPEILAYIEETVDAFDIRRHCRFGTGVKELHWIDKLSTWKLVTDQGEEYSYNVVVTCVGLLNVPRMLDVPGHDAFAGQIMHTARWQDNDFSNKRVAVIGTGSSSGQLVPALAPRVRELTVFQREPGWVIPTMAHERSTEQIFGGKLTPTRLRYERLKNFMQRELSAKVVLPGTYVHRARTKTCLDWLDSNVKDSQTRALLTPQYPFNCKRPVRDPNYLSAFNRENVKLVPHAVTRMTATGVCAADGSEHSADVVVFATGFRAADFLSTLKVTGQNGQDLHEYWNRAGGPEAYLGMTVSGFPNLFMLYGPNTNSATTSIIFVLECQARYMVRAVKAMARHGWKTLQVRPWVQRVYNRWLQKRAGKTTWLTGCHNYYRSSTGKVVTNWPRTAILYSFLLKVLPATLPFTYGKR